MEKVVESLNAVQAQQASLQNLLQIVMSRQEVLFEEVARQGSKLDNILKLVTGQVEDVDGKANLVLETKKNVDRLVAAAAPADVLPDTSRVGSHKLHGFSFPLVTVEEVCKLENELIGSVQSDFVSSYHNYILVNSLNGI